MKDRESINKELRAIYRKYNLLNGTFVVEMGTGKTKLGIDLIKEYEPDTVLIVSPSTNISGDTKELNVWEKEFIKWGNSISKVTYMTINKAYKLQNSYYDMIILDEVHAILTPEFSKVLKNNSFGRIIGLTGTPDIVDKKDKRYLYNTFCPIIAVYKNAAKDSIINKTRIFVFNYRLTNDLKTLSGNPKNPFKQGELDKYEYLNKNVRKLEKQLYSNGFEYFWKDSMHILKDKKAPDKLKILAGSYIKSIQNRKEFLLSLKLTVEYAKVIAKAVLDDINNKVLVFSERVDALSEITSNAISYKNSAQQNSKLIEDFNRGTIRILGASKKLTLGENLIGANYGIISNIVGSSVQFEQKKGRLHRLSVNETATMVILCAENTQQKAWTQNALKTMDSKTIVTYNDLNLLIKDIWKNH